MKETIYHYRDYKKYLNDLIDSYPNGGRGVKKTLGEAINCQSAFITHVLSGSNHFSPEQTVACSQFFGLTSDETEFLLLMVNQNRAGTEVLRKFYDKLIKQRVKTNHQLKDRLNIKSEFSNEDLAIYYSSWKYSAVHTLISIPEFQTSQQVAKRLRLSNKTVNSILEFLCTMGILDKKQNGLYQVINELHLDLNSPFTIQHHTSWRIQTIERYNQKKEESIHYSLAFSCSKKDMLELKKKIHQCIVDCNALIPPSPEETAGAFCVDFFEL